MPLKKLDATTVLFGQLSADPRFEKALYALPVNDRKVASKCLLEFVESAEDLEPVATRRSWDRFMADVKHATCGDD
jgi:hypothetical protein